MTNSNETSLKRKDKPSDFDSVDGPDPKALKNDSGGRCRAASSRSHSHGSNGGGGGGPVRILQSGIPIKSWNDPHEYKVLQLSNGLRVCLISRKEPGFWRLLFNILFGRRLHENSLPLQRMKFNFWNLFSCLPHDFTDMALSVNTGGLNDPEDAEGLAHFSEHVVHYGSKKFPREEEYHELTLNLGSANAYTTPMTTCYYCVVYDSVIDKTLNMFSEMHANPSMELDLIQREVHAVDSEFYFRQPYFRRQLLHSQLAGYQRDHPLRRLWAGKLETLGRGNKNGSKHVQRRMRNSHRKNYVASAMGLVLNSTKSIEELEQLTLKHFSKLQEGRRPVQHETNTKFDGKWKLPSKRLQIFLQGISSRAGLSLIWHLPASLWLEDMNEKTMEVIQQLLLTSHPRGLLSHLWDWGLIWGVQIHCEPTPYAILLELTFFLTEQGRSSQGTCHIQKATEEYIRFLLYVREADMSKYFDQMRICKLRDFRYGIKDASLDDTVSYVERLQKVENLEEIVNFGSWENAKYNYARIREGLWEMIRTGANVIHTIPKDIPLEVKLQEIDTNPLPKIKEGLFKTARYFTTPKKPLDCKKDFSNVFGFRPSSRYLQKDLLRFQQKNEEGGGDMSSSKWNLIPPENFENIRPQTLKHESREDAALRIPKVSGYHRGPLRKCLGNHLALVEEHFITPSYRTSSPRGAALFSLWAFYIRQRLSRSVTEFSFAGNLASIQIDEDTGTLTLNVLGFPGNMEEISTRCMEHVFDHPISETVFSLAKEEMKNYLETQLGNGALNTQLVLMLLLANKTDLTIDTLGILEDLTVNDLKCFIEASRKCTHSHIELSGNVPVKLFHSLAAALNKIDFAPILNSGPVSIKKFFPIFNFYKPGETCVRVKNRGNCTFTNHVTNLYIIGRESQGSKSMECFKAAMVFIHEKAVAFLRTKRQLAYVVVARPVMFEGFRLNYGLMGFRVDIIATAKNHTVCELDRNIDEFISEYPTMLRNMPNDVYDKTSELMGFKVTKEETAKWFTSKFGPEFRCNDHSLKCLMRGIRKVSIQEIGTGNPMSKQMKCDCQVCRGIQEWAKGRNYNSALEFAVGDKEYYDYFVRF